MTLRTRMSFWFVGMLLVSLLLMSGVLYFELFYEHRPAVPLEQQERPPKQMADILFMYGTVTLVVLLGGGWFFLRRVMAPLSALTDAAERIHSGNLNERLPRSGETDELDRLAAVLNAMLARLDDSFNHIREFTLHASHELKTPLTVMRGELENLLVQDSGTPAQRERLAGCLDEIQRLAQIVDNLALLTKADAGLVTLVRENVPLHVLIQEAYDDAEVLGEDLRLQVELAACEETHVRGDHHRLRQALLNLVDNAVKYNEPGGRLTLDLRRDGEQARIEITNTGPGIPTDELPRVCDRFHRGATARRTHPDGSGLGLSITQWIVQTHQGTLAIASVPGRLTTVIVTLPCLASSSERKNNTPESIQQRRTLPKNGDVFPFQR